MPKPNISTPIELAITEFAYLKKPTPEIFYDFNYILSFQLHRFGEHLSADVTARLQKKLNAAEKLTVKPQSPNRLYLITDIDVPELVLFNLEDCIAENIINTCDAIGEHDFFATPPYYCNTVFLFKDLGEPYHMDIGCKTFAELIRCYSTNNLLSNATIRDSWYGEPRRKAK